MMAQIDAKIAEKMNNIPNLDVDASLKPLMEGLNESIASMMNAQVEVLKNEMITSFEKKLASVEAVKGHKLAAAARQLGIQVDELTDSVEADLMAKAGEGTNGMQLAAMNLLSQPIPEKWAKENPLTAEAWKLGKLQLVQMIANNMQAAAGGQGSAVISKGKVVTETSGIFP
jgi:hypothetical protein